ncbi:hypothetical protein [Teredinibacter sp. KSP-S5-2]|uniref:hypothetical protein n=1 Tax=Teredinibacter sp. KSP-S5-2 TaxID=3034506 RepID=UPI002934CD7E|nr:hypothetical protein [Teredinibacter sp. KSP-S5-2]WNO10951.1 hypothetical protein P5V12_07150 [Teredinibacter sp. KSP-S5-2]
MLLFISPVSYAAPLNFSFNNSITILVPSDVLTTFQEFTKDKKVPEITDFSNTAIWRDVAELILQQQALRLGGFQGQIKYGVSNSYSRSLRLISQGKNLILGTTVWSLDANKYYGLWQSEALVSRGEYKVGLYALPSNYKAMNVRGKEGLKQLSGVTNQQWGPDKELLTQLDLKSVLYGPSFQSMVKMVAGKRADFMLLAFRSTEDLSFQYDNITLKPIPGVTVAFNDSRHWVVSDIHPDGKVIQMILNTGLAKLQKENKIVSAFEQVGVMHPLVKDWQVLNQEESR